MKEKHNIGDLVRIKSWEEMEEEFGVSSGFISCDGYFTENMKYLCGDIFQIKNIKMPTYYRSYPVYDLGLSGDFIITSDMFINLCKNNLDQITINEAMDNIAKENLEVINIALDKDAIIPTRAYNTDAGLDLYSKENAVVHYRNNYVFDTGVHIEIPKGYVGMIKSKSGLNVNYDITSEGVIDAGYTGSIKVKLYNHGFKDKIVNRGDKISQLVILPIKTPKLNVVDISEFNNTERSNNGFGSTGR